MKAYTRTEIATRQVIRVECVRAVDPIDAMRRFDAGEGELLKETVGPIINCEAPSLSEGWFTEPGLARSHYQKIHNLLGAEDRETLRQFADYIGAILHEDAPELPHQGLGLIADILNPEMIDDDGGNA